MNLQDTKKRVFKNTSVRTNLKFIKSEPGCVLVSRPQLLLILERSLKETFTDVKPRIHKSLDAACKQDVTHFDGSEGQGLVFSNFK